MVNVSVLYFNGLGSLVLNHFNHRNMSALNVQLQPCHTFHK